MTRRMCGMSTAAALALGLVAVCNSTPTPIKEGLSGDDLASVGLGRNKTFDGAPPAGGRTNTTRIHALYFDLDAANAVRPFT